MPVALRCHRVKEVQMSTDASRPTLWMRVIADEAFRAALIDDPLS